MPKPTPVKRRQALGSLGATLTASVWATQAGLAQAQSDRPVRLILPDATGSGVDAISRAAPDGNTLSVVSNNVVIFPSVLKSLPFDMPGDFTPIAMLGSTPVVLVVNPQKVAATETN